MDIGTALYRKAFVQYIRRGIPMEVSFKAAAETHPTTHYIWRTRGDDKVRSSHAANDGHLFAWDDPPPTGHPGEEYGCCCWAEPYYEPAYFPDDPPIESIYPEALVIPLLRVRWLYEAWQIWLHTREVSREWRLGNYKSPQRWANQLEEGGWTPERITAIIRNGKRYDAINRTRSNLPATRYRLGEEFVVIDNETFEIIQVSRPRPGGFKPNKF